METKLNISELTTFTPAQIVEDNRVENRFVNLYNGIHGSKVGELYYNKEKYNFMRLLEENPELKNCTQLSLYGAFLDVAVNGLSLDGNGRALCYVIPRKVKTNKKDERGYDTYETRAYLMITGYGELVLRKRAGQISYCDNPVVVYEGDTFKVSVGKGGKSVEYEASIPRKSNKIIGAFIRIVRADKTDDYAWLLEGDIARLRHFSEKANGYYDKDKKQRVDGKANALYNAADGQIDSGFLENKMIKHAFDAYPKVRTGGQFTTFEDEVLEADPDYGIEGIEQPAAESYEATVIDPEPFEPAQPAQPKSTYQSEIF
jgi:recombinational DNA repair protein RecT